MAVNTSADTHIGYGLWLLLGFYITGMFAVAIRSFYGRSSIHPQSSNISSGILKNFFRDPSFGRVALTFTLFTSIIACMTAGNISPDAYLDGFGAFRWIPAIQFVILGYLLVIARLLKLSYHRDYISPVDFINDRYRSQSLSYAASIIMMIPNTLFIGLMLRTMSSFIEIMSSAVISKFWGSVIIAIIILSIEVFGGLANTSIIDIWNGSIILLLFFIMYILQNSLFDGFSQIMNTLASSNSSISANPTSYNHIRWILWVMPFISLPLYPHIMSRLTLARSSYTFRFTLTMLSLLPFFCIPAIVSYTLDGRSLFPSLPNNSTMNSSSGTVIDIFALTTRLIMVQGGGAYLFGSLVICSLLSIMISTISNGLSGAAVIVSCDILSPVIGYRPSFYLVKLVSMINNVMIMGVAIISSYIVSWMDIPSWIGCMNGLMMQIIPAFVLGLYYPSISSRPITIGMVSGSVISLSIHLALALSTTIPADLGSFVGFMTNISIVYLLNGFFTDNVEMEDSEASVASSIDASISKYSQSEARSTEKEVGFGRFVTDIPSGLIGWRIKSDIDLQLALDEYPELSISTAPSFSATFAADHARIGSTTLGSVGRIGDGHTEPIHNPVLMVSAAVFLILSTPFYFSTDVVSTRSLPFWVYLSFISSCCAAGILIYIMFSSWDVLPFINRRRRSTSQHSKSDTGSLTEIVMADDARKSIEPSLDNDGKTVRDESPRKKRSFLNNFMGLKSSGRKQQRSTSGTGEKGRRVASFKNGAADNKKIKKSGQEISPTANSYRTDLGSFSIEEDVRRSRYK